MANIMLNATLYENAFNCYGVERPTGNLSDWIKNSTTKYYRGRCPVWYVEMYHANQRIVIGGNYGLTGKPQLTIDTRLDFD